MSVPGPMFGAMEHLGGRTGMFGPMEHLGGPEGPNPLIFLMSGNMFQNAVLNRRECLGLGNI